MMALDGESWRVANRRGCRERPGGAAGYGLLLSLQNPHREAADLAETGVADWAASLPAEDEGLVDVSAGKAVRWIEGRGWVEDLA